MIKAFSIDYAIQELLYYSFPSIASVWPATGMTDDRISHGRGGSFWDGRAGHNNMFIGCQSGSPFASGNGVAWLRLYP